MTSRERLLAVLRGERPDRLPWAPLIDNYFFSSLDEHRQRQGYAAFCESVGCDLMQRHVPVVEAYYEQPVKLKVRPLGDGLEETVLVTPLGVLKQVVEHHLGTSRYVEHFIKSVDDLPAFTLAQDHKRFRARYDAFERVDREIGERGIAVATAPPTPLALMHEEYMGLANTIYALFDEQEAMERAMDAIHRANLRELELVAGSPTPAVFSYEDTSTTTISRDLYNRYCLPALNEYKQVCTEHGQLYIVHMCGKLSGFWDLIARTEMDGIDSVCPPGSGDVELWEARAFWPRKLLIGGVEPASLAMLGEAELAKKIETVLENIRGMSGLILSTGDAVPHGTKVRNIELVSKILGRLPSWTREGTSCDIRKLWSSARAAPASD